MKSGEQSGSREQGIYGKKDENDKSGEGKKVILLCKLLFNC